MLINTSTCILISNLIGEALYLVDLLLRLYLYDATQVLEGVEDREEVRGRRHWVQHNTVSLLTDNTLRHSHLMDRLLNTNTQDIQYSKKSIDGQSEKKNLWSGHPPPHRLTSGHPPPHRLTSGHPPPHRFTSGHPPPSRTPTPSQVHLWTPAPSQSPLDTRPLTG